MLAEFLKLKMHKHCNRAECLASLARLVRACCVLPHKHAIIRGALLAGWVFTETAPAPWRCHSRRWGKMQKIMTVYRRFAGALWPDSSRLESTDWKQRFQGLPQTPTGNQMCTVLSHPPFLLLFTGKKPELCTLGRWISGTTRPPVFPGAAF